MPQNSKIEIIAWKIAVPILLEKPRIASHTLGEMVGVCHNTASDFKNLFFEHKESIELMLSKTYKLTI